MFSLYKYGPNERHQSPITGWELHLLGKFVLTFRVF